MEKINRRIRPHLHQLTINLPFKPVTFMEIGSRDGHDTKEIADYWDLDYKNCYIIEAYPELSDRIKKQYPEFNIFSFAASNKKGTASFNAIKLDKNLNIGTSSVLDCLVYDIPYDKITVNTDTVFNLLNENNLNGIDLIKIDVEGFTQEVLDGFGDKLTNVKAFQIETEKSEMWKGQKTHNEIVEFMKINNFELIDKVPHYGNQYDCLFINKKSL